MEIAVWDPAFYQDDDGRLSVYWGCSNQRPIYGVELDKDDFSFIREPTALIYANSGEYGWEVPGDYKYKNRHKSLDRGSLDEQTPG